MAPRVAAGSSSGPRPLGESTEVPCALLCFLMLFIQSTASHSPELRPFEIPTKNDLKWAVTWWDALPAPSLPAVGEEGHIVYLPQTFRFLILLPWQGFSAEQTR